MGVETAAFLVLVVVAVVGGVIANSVVDWLRGDAGALPEDAVGRNGPCIVCGADRTGEHSGPCPECGFDRSDPDDPEVEKALEWFAVLEEFERRLVEGLSSGELVTTGALALIREQPEIDAEDLPRWSIDFSSPGRFREIVEEYLEAIVEAKSEIESIRRRVRDESAERATDAGPSNTHW